MATSHSDRSTLIFIQSLIGLVAASAWILVSVYVANQELVGAAVQAVPYFLAFEAGIMTRHLPVVREAARALRQWSRARGRM